MILARFSKNCILVMYACKTQMKRGS
ncbi:hypothetical protein [Sicyoidochytrium minutum DNA virus]|nr:hypothetical protein [Sicyoidochytrium minutum DNA virus]